MLHNVSNMSQLMTDKMEHQLSLVSYVYHVYCRDTITHSCMDYVTMDDVWKWAILRSGQLMEVPKYEESSSVRQKTTITSHQTVGISY